MFLHLSPDLLSSFIGGLSTSLTYGLPVQRQNDPVVRFAEETFALSTGTVAPGKYYVNVFPILRHIPEWMPGSGFKQEAKEIKKMLDRVTEEPYQKTLEMMVRIKSTLPVRTLFKILNKGEDGDSKLFRFG